MKGICMSVDEKVVPAASVVLIRKSDSGFKVLLLKRNPELAYLGGAWVFPGGRVDENDLDGSIGRESMAAAGKAAVRETEEECGLRLSPRDLVPMSIWITPTGLPRRFSTHFFLAVDNGGAVRVDGREILHHMWMSPDDALLAHRAGDMIFAPPNFVILTHLSGHRTVESVVEHYRHSDFQNFRPRLVNGPDGICSLYEEDDDYDEDNPRSNGGRHRLWMKDSGWEYERNR